MPNFQAPGILVPNVFTNRTEALRVSEHYCRMVTQRTENESWGCWRWEDSDGWNILQFCAPFPQDQGLHGNLLEYDTPLDLQPLPMPAFPAKLARLSEEILRHAAAVKLQIGRSQRNKTVEKDYHDALADRLSRYGFGVNPYFSLPVPGASTREIDILVDNTVIIEVKKENWDNIACRWRNYVQGYYYCKTAKRSLCMVINFASSPPDVMWVTPDDGLTLAQ